MLAHFTGEERKAPRPLPATRFENFREVKRKVSRDGHVEVAKAFYSVPPEYRGREVWVRRNGRSVRVFNDRIRQIAMHVVHDHGRYSTDPAHLDPTKINGLERGSAYLLGKARSIGPQTHASAEAVVAARGIEGHRVVQGLLAITRKHTCTELERACETALVNQCYRLRLLRQLAARHADKQQPPEFLTEHPIIRPLDQFDWDFNAALPRRLLFELATGRFLDESRDVLLMGPPGTGKTHIAQTIGYAAIKQGRTALDRSTFNVIHDFLRAEALGDDDATIATYLRPDLLIIDDMGMK